MAGMYRTLVAILLVLMVSGLPEGLAATQGTLGATSTGTIVVSLSIPPRFQISGLQDFALGSYSGSGPMAGNADICVYTNGTGDYHVLITDSSGMSPAGFSVQKADASADIPYAIRWNNATGTDANQPVTYDAALAAFGANMQSVDCSTGGKSANIEVSFAEADLQPVAGGDYSTAIAIVIEP